PAVARRPALPPRTPPFRPCADVLALSAVPRRRLRWQPLLLGAAGLGLSDRMGVPQCMEPRNSGRRLPPTTPPTDDSQQLQGADPLRATLSSSPATRFPRSLA